MVERPCVGQPTKTADESGGKSSLCEAGRGSHPLPHHSLLQVNSGGGEGFRMTPPSREIAGKGFDLSSPEGCRDNVAKTVYSISSVCESEKCVRHANGSFECAKNYCWFKKCEYVNKSRKSHS